MPWTSESNHMTAFDSVAPPQLTRDAAPVFQFLGKLRELREGSHLCDTTVHVNGAEFCAHRAVLAAWSPRLATDILGTSQFAAKISIFLDYDHSTAFAECLRYMYSGEITPTLEHVGHILHLGKVLMLESLCKKCEEFLVSQVKLENFVDLYFMALKHDLDTLQEAVAEFVKFNITSVIDYEALLRLEPQDFKIFITHGKMANLSQEVKFSLIIGWVGLNVPDRDKYLLHLFNHLSWSSSVDDLLTQITMTQNIFTTNNLCLFQLLYSLVISQGHSLGPFTSTYPKLHLMYSQLLDDLAQPKAFHNPTNFPMAIGPIAVSVSVESVNSSCRPKGRDAWVNTDFSYADNFVLPVQVCQESLEKDEGVKCNVMLKKNIEGSASVSRKHRRKSLPRKIKVEDSSNVKVKDTKSKRTKKSKKAGTKKRHKKASNYHADDFVERLNDLTDQTNDIADPKEDVGIVPVVVEHKENVSDAYVTTEGPTSDKVSPDNDIDDAVESDLESENIDTSKTECSETEGVATNEKKSIKISINLNKRCRGRSVVLKKSSRNSALKADKNNLKRAHNNNKSHALKLQKQSCSYENCDFVCRKPEMLEKHVERVHITNVELVCYKCDFKTNDMKSLCLHAKSHYTKPPYRCEFQDCRDTFMQISFLIRHHMTHMNLKPYQCDLCLKQFTVYNRLSCHKKLHEGRQFQCDVCHKHFTTKGCMQQHRMIHFNSKPYLCDTCGFSTKHQSHLISHQKIHTGNVLRCTYPDCTYTTPKQGHMTQHMNSHLNIRNHICQVCGKSFVVRGKLLRHERIHLKDKLFKCKQCDYQTSRTDRMKLHIESHGIKFRKKKYNSPPVEEEDTSQEVDFHQYYERIQPTLESLSFTDSSVSSATFSILTASIPDFTMADMKHVDVLSFSACRSGIVEGYTAGKLIAIDSLQTAAAVAGIDEIHTSGFNQNFERMHATPFDQI